MVSIARGGLVANTHILFTFMVALQVESLKKLLLIALAVAALQLPAG